MKYTMFRLLIVIKVLSVFVVSELNAARILCVFPTPSISHHIVYRSLTRVLAERGHDVVVITPHPSFAPGESPANITEIDVHECSYHIWMDGISKLLHKTSDVLKLAGIYYNVFRNIFEKQIQSKPVRDLIDNEKNKFDLLFLESNILSTLGLLNVFDVPAIEISTFGPMLGTYSMFGAPDHPLVYPTAITLRINNVTTWEAITNLYNTVICSYAKYIHEPEENEMLHRNLGMDILPISKLHERVNMFVQTVYPIWMNNPPVPSNIVYLGGLRQKPPNNLPQDLQKFLDLSESGAIYVSFGSNIHSSLISQEKMNMMAKVFSKLPYNVVWKSDQSIQNETSKNIHISAWFPQSDLLFHPNIKLFITHGGLQSTEEAIMAGVPLIGIPMFGDQWMNSENYVQFKIGLKLDFTTLSEEQLIRSIASVIEDESYTENVARLRKVMTDQPQSAVDRVIWWTEYLLKHGTTEHLRPLSANISLLQYYEVELIIIVVVGITFVFTVLSLIIRRLAHCICRRKPRRKYSKIIELIHGS